MKTIKIRDDVHKEVKMFAAEKEVNIFDIANNAILLWLDNAGHKFNKIRPSSKLKSSNKK